MPHGEMPEWSNGPPWKGGVRETVPRVRIPVSPPFYFFRFLKIKFTFLSAISSGGRATDS